MKSIKRSKFFAPPVFSEGQFRIVQDGYRSKNMGRFLISSAVRYLFREDDGYFAQSHDFTVFFPGTLVYHLADAVLFYGIDVLAAGLQQVPYDRFGPVAVAVHQVLSYEVSVLYVCFPCFCIHIKYHPVPVAYRYGAVHFFRPVRDSPADNVYPVPYFFSAGSVVEAASVHGLFHGPEPAGGYHETENVLVEPLSCGRIGQAYESPEPFCPVFPDGICYYR